MDEAISALNLPDDAWARIGRCPIAEQVAEETQDIVPRMEPGATKDVPVLPPAQQPIDDEGDRQHSIDHHENNSG